MQTLTKVEGAQNRTTGQTLAPAPAVEQSAPLEQVQLSGGASLPAAPQDNVVERQAPGPLPDAHAYSSPATLTMEDPGLVSTTEASGNSVLTTMTKAMEARSASDAHWSTALEAFTSLPDDDKAAAGKRAFYTQAAMLPEFSETLAGLPEDQKHTLPTLLMSAKDQGILNGDQLSTMVSDWSEKNPEQAYIAQMSGFADYADEQLVAAAFAQGVGSLTELNVGPREESLLNLSTHGNSYVGTRGQFLNGAHELFAAGHSDLASQLLNS